MCAAQANAGRYGLMNRRRIIGGFSALLLAAALPVGLGGCSDAGGHDLGLGTAGHGSLSFTMRDQVAWVQGEDLVIVFSDQPFTTETRHQVVRGEGVNFPAGQRVLEMRFAGVVENAAPGMALVSDAEGSGASRKANGLLVTYWNFTDIPIVVQKTPEEMNQQHVLVNLDGEVRGGGWATGSTRGTAVATMASGERASFLWNLDFQVTL